MNRTLFLISCFVHHNTAAMMEHGAGEDRGLTGRRFSTLLDLQRFKQDVQARETDHTV